MTAVKQYSSEEMLWLSQLKMSIHLNCIMSALTVLVSYYRTMKLSCLSQLLTHPKPLSSDLKHFSIHKIAVLNGMMEISEGDLGRVISLNRSY